MARAPVVITLTPAQRELIREASGKCVAKLAVECVDTGDGWLHAAGGDKFWLLKHSNPEAYAAARRNRQPHIDQRYTRFRLKIQESGIHRLGVFADEKIPARRNVIQYIGELVNPVESYRRGKETAEIYTFRLDKFWRIDGSVGGSGAEFINHSCDPNLRCRKFKDRILCQSFRPIEVGEELTIDYSFSPKAPQVPCRCGSPKCRGTINAIADDKSAIAHSARWKSRDKKKTYP